MVIYNVTYLYIEEKHGSAFKDRIPSFLTARGHMGARNHPKEGRYYLWVIKLRSMSTSPSGIVHNLKSLDMMAVEQQPLSTLVGFEAWGSFIARLDVVFNRPQQNPPKLLESQRCVAAAVSHAAKQTIRPGV